MKKTPTKLQNKSEERKFPGFSAWERMETLHEQGWELSNGAAPASAGQVQVRNCCL